MSNTIQSSYTDTIAKFLAGGRLSLYGKYATKIAEGDISFGYAVIRGTDTEDQAKVGCGPTCIGISMRSQVSERDDSGIDKIHDKQPFEILKDGMTIASPSNAVTPGMAVCANNTTGRLKGGVAGAGETQLKGCVWESTAAENGLAKLTVNIADVPLSATALSATATETARSFSQNVAITAFTPLVGAGGSGSFNYFVMEGTLPAGLALNASTGAISGTPTATQAATPITIAAQDAISGLLVPNTATFTIAVTA